MTPVRQSDPFSEFVDLSNHIISGEPIQIIKQDLTLEKKKKPSRVKLSPITGKITEIFLSKSLLSKLQWKGEPYPLCPYNVWKTQLLRDISTPTSDSQLKGLYFESKCLGSSANNEKTYDLPRHKRTGAKLSDHERIDDAIDRFFKVTKDYNMVVDPTFTQIYNRELLIDPDRKFDIVIYLEGTLDFISPINTGKIKYDAINVDLKLTKDRDICVAFEMGNYHIMPWACMENADFMEAMFYRKLFKLPFMYFVFDYKKDNPGHVVLPIITDVNDPIPANAKIAQQRDYDLTHVIRWAVGQILFWEASGWPLEPSTDNCKACPIYDCKRRNEIQPI